MSWFVMTFIVLLLSGVSVSGELKTVITAIPKTRCFVSADSSHCGPIPKERQEGLRMTLMKDQTAETGKYYWMISGQPREVEYEWSNFFDIYHSGGGLVVVEKTGEMTKTMGKYTASKPKTHPNFRYMEITRLHLTTYTYFGDATFYDP